MPVIKPTVPAAASSTTSDRVPESFWANIGLMSQYETDEGIQEQFVSLNYGIPLSSVPEVKLGSSPDYNALMLARQNLYEQVMEIAQGLDEGETFNVPVVMQIRRVKSADSKKSEVSSNAYTVKLLG
jgi:hypothetical protein